MFSEEGDNENRKMPAILDAAFAAQGELLRPVSVIFIQEIKIQTVAVHGETASKGSQENDRKMPALLGKSLSSAGFTTQGA